MVWSEGNSKLSYATVMFVLLRNEILLDGHVGFRVSCFVPLFLGCVALACVARHTPPLFPLFRSFPGGFESAILFVLRPQFVSRRQKTDGQQR